MLVIGRFMQAFARSNELYLEGEPTSLPECWCENGVNVASEAAADEVPPAPAASDDRAAATSSRWTCFAARRWPP